MEDDFELPVTYKCKELLFPGKLILSRYAYKIQLDIEGVEVSYERDDGGFWRVLMNESDLEKHRSIDKGLLQAIAERMEELL